MSFVEECKNCSIETTTEYLAKYPTLAAKGAETKEKQINNIEIFFSSKIAPNEQTTKPDYLVSIVLELLFKYKDLLRFLTD